MNQVELPNKPDPANPAITSLLLIGSHPTQGIMTTAYNRLGPTAAAGTGGLFTCKQG
jgi:hypothetical protein